VPTHLRRLLLFTGTLCLVSSLLNPVFLKAGSGLHNFIFLGTTGVSVLAVLVVVVGKRSFLSTYPTPEVNWAFTPFFISALISLVVLALLVYVKLTNA